MTDARRRPGPAFTGRAAILAVVLVGLVLVLAYPLQNYLGQRGEIAAAERERDRAAERVAELEAEAARWRDPAFVEQQAKERLYFVRPGERAYVVLPPEGGERPDPPTVVVAEPEDVAGTWYERVWSTVDGAAAALR